MSKRAVRGLAVSGLLQGLRDLSADLGCLGAAVIRRYRRAGVRGRAGRRFRGEQLEDRLLLTLNVGLTANGDLLLSESSSGVDDLQVDYDTSKSEFIFKDANYSLTTTIFGATGGGTKEVRVPKSKVSGTQILVQTGAQSDVISVNAGFNPGSTFGLNLDGGTGTDLVKWTSAAQLASASITAESAEVDAVEVRTVSGQTWTTDISLFNNTKFMASNISVQSLSAGPKNLTVDATGLVTINGVVSATTSAFISMTGHQGVLLNAGSQVTVELGNLTLSAGTGAAGSALRILDGKVKSQGGTITLQGNSGSSASAGSSGVLLQGAEIVNQGAGDIFVIGTTAAGASSPGAGVSILSGAASSSLRSFNGLIEIWGYGGAAGSMGSELLAAEVLTQGSGAISVIGTSDSLAVGLKVASTSRIEAAGTGTVHVEGAGGGVPQPTITFSGLAASTPSPYTESGLRFTSANNFSNQYPQQMVGSTATSGFVDVTTVDGQLFSVQSMRLSETKGSIGPRSVTFTGTRLDGGTVQHTYTTDSKFEAETVVLSGFSGLTNFRFTFNETTWNDLQWSYSAPLDVSFGLAEVRAASGDVSIAAARLELTNVLTLNVPNTVELWQSITGSGGLVKAGSGTVRVSSQAKYTGLTKVVSGLLKVDGSLAGSVTADGPGQVSGVGLVSGVLETSGTGSILPGGIPGVLTAGGLQLGASGTLQADIGGTTAGSQHDQLVVNGTASISGSLQISLQAAYTGVANDQILLIANDGTDAVVGTFAGLPEGSVLTTGAVRWQVSYKGGTGNDVVLTCVGHQFVVTTTSSSGTGSLYQAIVNANATAGTDEIVFTVAGQIAVSSTYPLPAIAGTVVIDGSTAPGFAGAPVVEISGASAGNVSGFVFAAGSGGSGLRGLSIVLFAKSGIELNTSDLWLQGNWIGVNRAGAAGGNGTGGGTAGVVIRGAGAVIGGLASGAGNVISGNAGRGILVDGGNSAVIQGNRIGTTTAGTAALANTGYGVQIVSGTNNQIGGASSAAMNVIAGNSSAGIILENAGTKGTLIYGNWLGVNVAGNRLANGASSIAVINSASGTRIGGRLTGEGNIIGGSFDQGIYLANTDQTQIRGNRIGTNPAGSAKSENFHGVFVTGSNPGLQIGGGEVGDGNLISGNNGDGIRVSSATGAIAIQGNLVGTDAAGAVALANGGSGIYVSQSPGVLIGGTTAATRNVISGNTGPGVWVTGSASTGGIIEGNYVGVRADGQGGVANASGGVLIDGGASDVVIGVAGYGNVISGNNLYGIRVKDAQGSQISGNLVGARPDGKTWLGNSGPGVYLTGNVTGTLLGGSVSGSGNVVSGNSYGIHLDQTSGAVRISGNRVGTTADGMAGLGNANYGIFAYRSQSIVIGTNGDGTGDDLEGNQVSGNGNFEGAGDGIVVDGNNNTVFGAVDSIVIAGNRIGTTADGMSGLWNRSAGVALRNGVSGVRIGTDGNGVSDVVERNVISGNEYYGIHVSGATTSGNVIAGNYVGLKADGLVPLWNGFAGIRLTSETHHNRVGTDNSDDANNASERNVVAGGTASIDISTAHDNVIAGNYVGLTADGVTGLSSNFGIVVAAGSKRNRIGTDGIGPANDRERNVIGSDTAFGRIYVGDAGTDDTVIAGNYIGLNAAGTSSAAYSNKGVVVTNGAKRTVIGTEGDGVNDSDQRNVITSNGMGLLVTGVGTTDTVIAGNYIGVQPDGLTGYGNTFTLEVSGGAQKTRIGTDGSNDAFNVNERNLLCSGGFGVLLSQTSDVVIAGNYIGVAANGTKVLQHNTYGIRVSNQVTGLRIGTDGNGVADSVEGNVISGNQSGLQLYNWDIMDLATADKLLSGAILSTTATATIPQADLTIAAGGVAGNWGNNHLLPGRGGNYFAFRASGVLKVNTAGDYTVAMSADRGGRLLIDGVARIVDDGNHGGMLTSRVTVNLTVGDHTLEWQGFEEHSGAGFELSVAEGAGVTSAITTANGWKVLGDAVPHSGIELKGSLSVTAYYPAALNSNAVVAGNLIGVLADGMTKAANYSYGIYSNVDGIRFGGSLPVERNVISGNTGSGLVLDGFGLNNTGVVVSGNYVGVGIDGVTDVGNGATGIYVGASNALIGGLNTSATGSVAGAGNLVSGNSGIGVHVGASTIGVQVQGNFIGTDISGSLAVKNDQEGVVLEGSTALLGGSVPARRNLISGNGLEGVRVTGIQNLVQGNFIGTSATGNSKLPNGGTSGVYIKNGVSNLIGVRDDGEGDAAEGNLISGSTKYGVRVEGSDKTILAGNRIGTNAAGTASLSNGLGGVLIVSGTANLIGTDADGVSDGLEGNLISGNEGPGISSDGESVTQTVIAGNIIGAAVGGTSILANSGAGIDFGNDAKHNRIGGSKSVERNVISGNEGGGIRITGAGSVQNWIAGNLIGVDVAGAVALANGGEGIALLGAVQNVIGTNGDGNGDATEGNVISGNYIGIKLAGGGSHVVAGNLVGTTRTGTAAIANRYGLWVSSVGNRIGSDGNGVSDGFERNVISGNTFDGVAMGGELSSDNVLRGNYVGTTVSGMTALANGNFGIVLGGSNNSVVGGTGVLRGVISGNAYAGVLISGGVGNSVSGSMIGLAVDGSTVVANGGSGVIINGGALGTGVGVLGGNVISGNLGDGVTVSGSMQSYIRGNFIGTVASGLAAAANAGHGVLVTDDATGVLVGSPIGQLADRNLISGNSLSGVAFINAGTDNRVQGNYIGTDISGSLALGNASMAGAFGGGVYISDGGGSQVLVGVDHGQGRHEGSANLISGNAVAGVLIRGTTSAAGGHVVAGNLIGLKAGGGATLGNAGPGVWVLDSSNNIIGSNGDKEFDTGESNVISGNRRPGAASAAQYAPGVLVQDSTAGDGIQTRGNVIAGNAIGTDATGVKPLANQGHGVVVLSAFETQIGVPAAGNLIRYNGGAGVRIEGVAENGSQASAVSTVSSNSFQANTGLPVDLGAVGITLNSTADAVTDFPIFTSAAIEDGKMTLIGFAPAGAAFELYLNAGRAGQQFGDGVTPMLSFKEGSASDLDNTTGSYGPVERGVTVSAAAITQNRFKFTFALPNGLTSGVQMTGLMTGPVSEFSPLILAGEQGSAVPPEITLDLATSTVSLNEGDKLSVDGAFYDPDSRAWTGTVNYGDGSGVQPLALTSSREFELTHTYTTPGTWTVTVEIVDNGLAVGTKSFTVQVANLVPVVDFSGFSLTKTVTEGGTATLAGSFTDGDGAHVVQVTWGDGGTSTVNLASGVYSFSATHVYADDSNSAGTVTATDVYAISVTVRDAVSASGTDSPAGLFLVEVSNQAPTVGAVQFGGTTVAAGGTVSVNEGTPLVVSGVFTDPGLLDVHTVRMDWGDGTKSVVTLPVGDRVFGTQSAFSHSYADNSSSGPYVLTMEFWDDDQPAEPTRLTWNINVADVSASGVTVSAVPATASEMQTIQISGSFVDPGTGDSHQVRVVWGDGSPDSVLNLGPGVLTFGGSVLTHAYPDNAAAGASYTVQVTVSDLADAAAAGTGSTSVLVQNVSPTMVGTLLVTRADGTAGAVNEGDVVIVTGAFADVSPVDRHRVLISWGDGRAATEASVNADDRTFTARYTYRDNFAAASITAQVLDGRFSGGVFEADGGSVVSAAVTQQVNNVAPAARIAPRLGSTPGATLLTVDVVEPGLDDVLTYLWEINTGIGGYTTAGTAKNLTFDSTLLGTPLIRVTVSDDDGGTDDYEVIAVFGTDSAETLAVTSTGFTRSGSGFGGVGLSPGEGLWSNQILVLGFAGGDLLDASALPSGFTAILDGGQQQDYLLGGAGADFFYPNDGNDTVDGGEGSDSYVLKPNSVLTVIDTSGDNVLDFSLAEFGNTTGISYDLTKIRSTGLPDADSDAQVVSTAGGVNHIVAAYGTFSTLVGSSYADSFIAASGSTVDGGGGKDTLYVGAGTTNATISGGADDDVLITSGTGITGLNFSGDDGFDYLKNTGSITGLTFGGGADDDILENVGSILGTLNFGGDDGVDILTNTGTIGTLVFSGGADDDIFVNNGSSNVTLSFGGDDDILLSGAGTVGTLVFGGDSGADIFANLGTITSLTFNGGADDDVFVNVGSSTSLNFGGDDDVLLSNSGTVGSIGTLNFGGDDGADILRNFGSLGTLTFSGGADDDILQNAVGATLTSLSFGGDDGIDTLWNQGAVTTLTFGGGADDDILLNSAGGTISSLNFSGDDGSDLLNNVGTVGTLTFGGGADDDILANTGSITGSLNFGGDDGADLLRNSGTIAGLTFGGGADDDILLNSGTGTIATLGFGGDDGIDTLQNSGAVTTLNFGGGADGDIFINLSGASVGTMFFGGGYEADGSGGWRPLATAADDGADSLANSGTITSLVFRGGADDDVLLNAAGGLITTLKFGGDDGADLLRNLGTATNLTFGGGADDDILVNTGTVAGSLVFGGDQQFDAAGNLQPIGKLSDDGADTLANYGTVGSIVFGGGADDDILLNSGTGSVTGSLSFAGDSGDDVFRNEGLAGSLVFTGGADDDVLVNLSAGIGTINFGGDAGDDILLNQGSGVGTLTFTGGADDDLLLNTASTLTTLTFSGGADDDVLQNSGGSITTLTFTGDSGADILRNTGSGITSLVFGGGADDDILSSTGTNIGSLVFGGDIDAGTGLPIAGTNYGADRLILSGSGTGAGTSTVLFQGDDGADAFLNSATGFVTITFNGGADDDVFQNTASSIGGITFSGGADDDVLQNSGASLTSLVFGGDSGADVLYNTGATVSGLVFTGGADDDVFYNTGAALSGAIFTGGADDDVLVNSGADVSGLVFTGGADDDVLQNSGTGLLDLVFSGDAGNDRFWNRSAAVNASNLSFTGADGDDLFLNDAGGAAGLTFTGGADDDAFQNAGVNISGLVFEGGADDDVFVNTSAGSILDLRFGGGADDDILQNSGGITTLLIGGGADSDTLANWGSVTSLEFMGDGQFDSNGDLQQISNAADDGVDTLVNYGTVQSLTFGGGADDDALVNNGEVTTLTFNGGADDDTLQNNDVVTALTFNGGADDDVLIANADGVGSILFNGDDGVDSLINNGDAFASLTFNGGAGADVLRVHGTGLGSIIFNGGSDAAADTFNYSGTGATGSGVTYAGGAGNDLLAWRGSADTLSFTGGAGDDSCIIVGSGTLSLDGGDGNDTVYFQADLQATVTVVEGGGDSSDTSSDTLNFSSYTGSALNLDLRSTDAQALSSKFSLTLSNELGLENVVGTAGADTIYGNARNNRIEGAEYSVGYGTATGGTRGQTQWVLLNFDTRTDLAAGEHEYTAAEREAIRARVQAVYRGPDSGSPWFDVQVVLAAASIPSGVSEYVTIFFNDTPAFGRPGGLASEIDPGNLSFGGTAVVQVNGLLGGVITADDTGGEGGDADAYKGYQPGFGDEQIGASKPDATSENFVLLSAKIAAHELAHLMGLRHQDSFGPIGFGVHDPPGVNGYNPQFPGPAGGVETFDHLLGTGASVGSDRFNDLRNLFFGEREAIKLALSVSDHSQTFATESSSAHGTYLTAQALALTTVAVPNTLSTGLNENKSIYVQMKSVVGAIAVDSGTGKSQNDWYSFTGSAGDVVNLDLYSNSLTRYGTAADNYIDSIVRVWYVQGGVLTEVPWFTSTAVNDDIFEPTDSSILDLLLPVTGTYYVEVDTFKRDPSSALFDASNPSSPLNPSNPNNLLRPGYEDLLKRFLDTRDDTDIGQYQLVLSRFTKSNESDGTDTIRGYGGVDQIDAGSGDDYSLVVTVGSAGSSTEGAVFSRSISVTDRAATNWAGSTVNYGDGSGNQSLTVAADGTATLSHTWTDNGTYTVTVTIVDDIGQSKTETFNVTVSNVNPVLLTLTGESNPIEGTTHTYSFTASDIGADTFSLFSVSGGSFGTISDFAVNSNTGAGSFKVTFGTGASTVVSLKLQDDDGGVSNQLTLTATIQLLNNAPTNISLSPASVSENVASGTVVGTLSSTDPDGDAVFTYSLVAGAGSTDNALFSISGGQLRTAAVFDYEQSATRSVRIRTTDAGGLSFDKAFTVTITDVLDETAPVSTLAALAVNATTVNLTISASGSDPGANASGVKEFELYYSTGSGYSLFATVPAASPSTAFTALPNKTYWFYSRAVDNAGNREAKSTPDTYTTVGDLLPPTSEVSSLSWNSSGQFEMQIIGAKPSGRVLQYFDVYMTIDGGAATKVDSVTALQTTPGQFSAVSRVIGLLDGQQHTYGFYTRAVDGTGNVEAAPSLPDKTATATFAAPGLTPLGIRVQDGMSQRSWIRVLDIRFASDPSSVSASRLKVERLPINAASINAVAWQSVTGYSVTASAADKSLRLDFGATGLGGLREAGDGFYRVSMDVNGNSSFADTQDASFEFFRLFGDASGNGVVNADDAALVLREVGKTGPGWNGDVDGSGRVDSVDRSHVNRLLGRKIMDWMFSWLDA